MITFLLAVGVYILALTCVYLWASLTNAEATIHRLRDERDNAWTQGMGEMSKNKTVF